MRQVPSDASERGWLPALSAKKNGARFWRAPKFRRCGTPVGRSPSEWLRQCNAGRSASRQDPGWALSRNTSVRSLLPPRRAPSGWSGKISLRSRRLSRRKRHIVRMSRINFITIIASCPVAAYGGPNCGGLRPEPVGAAWSGGVFARYVAPGVNPVPRFGSRFSSLPNRFVG